MLEAIMIQLQLLTVRNQAKLAENNQPDCNAHHRDENFNKILQRH